MMAEHVADGGTPTISVEGITSSGRPLPLNSRRLTSLMMKQIARGLEIPGTSSGDELRQLIEGKLIEESHDPKNTQVVCHNVEGGLQLALQDVDGVFLTIDPIEIEVPPPADIAELGESSDESVEGLKEALRRAEALQTDLTQAVDRLQRLLEKEKEKSTNLWKLNCSQLSEFDDALVSKDEEIARLKEQLRRTGGVVPHETIEEVESDAGTPISVTVPVPSHRRGRAPPVDLFTGEDPELSLDDWLPTLERAARWNGWTPDELMIQLAGHLKGRASQEWSLMSGEEKTRFSSAVDALRSRLDSGQKTMAAQDFRHVSQESDENVSDFIRRLERTFQRAYGKDGMQPDTRSTLLYTQLQEGLKFDLLKSPAVSGSLNYQALCVAAKNEERRLAELHKRKQYLNGQRPPKRPSTGQTTVSNTTKVPEEPVKASSKTGFKGRKCWNCGTAGHLAVNCPKPKKESSGRSPGSAERATKANLVTVTPTSGAQDILEDPMSYLLSDSDDEAQVSQIRVEDHGSSTRLATVLVGGVVSVDGVVDSAAELTIMDGETFKKVATAAKLHKRDFKPADKVPHTYDGKPFQVDGKVELDITFQSRTMRTEIYVKMDAREPLLLSEGVCAQLGIISYHADVHTKTLRKDTSEVKIRLVKDVKLPPRGDLHVVAEVEWQGVKSGDPLLLESDQALRELCGVQFADTVVAVQGDDQAQVVLTSDLGFTQTLKAGAEIGRVIPVRVVNAVTSEDNSAEQRVDKTENTSLADSQKRKQQLRDVLSQELADNADHAELLHLLERHHNAFSLGQEDRGETDLVELHIDTGDAVPRKYPVRRVPFAVRDEIACKLEEMQKSGVIQASSSPWASPVVLVKKKDGTLRFCVDYRGLNAVTKPDQFPLPRIDDLLDQLGRARYFTTLDLASGYWQIRVDKQSQEKTAFVTPQGLFEFRVMPFGLTNAPAVFQRLMQRVLEGVKTKDGKECVGVYIDDVLIFSETLEEHLDHLRVVLERLERAGLKLKPTKCHFLRQCVEYLGHLITPEGLKPNPEQVRAVVQFPLPTSVTQVRQFLGLTSYYRRFVAQFAKIAAPLHRLTKKDVKFGWSSDCQEAFETLKSRITEAPILVYPDFSREFVLETDACGTGLGAVLSQYQDSSILLPVAYASRSLSPAESNYSITELETLAVVWAMQHFRAYLYGHSVKVLTDHSAVRAILGAPNPTGKHARWWLKVFGSGVKDIQIAYRPGKENDRADALSRNPIQNADHLEIEPQVAVVRGSSASCQEISHLIQMDDSTDDLVAIESDFIDEQRKDPHLLSLISYLEEGELPTVEAEARRTVAEAQQFAVIDGVLNFVDQKSGAKRVAVPSQLRERILRENHAGEPAGPAVEEDEGEDTGPAVTESEVVGDSTSTLPEEPEMDCPAEEASTARRNPRYGLRSKTAAPQRLMCVRDEPSFNGRGDVTI